MRPDGVREFYGLRAAEFASAHLEIAPPGLPVLGAPSRIQPRGLRPLIAGHLLPAARAIARPLAVGRHARLGHRGWTLSTNAARTHHVDHRTG